MDETTKKTVKRLRICGHGGTCLDCDLFTKDGGLGDHQEQCDALLNQAADIIEKLCAELEAAKADMKQAAICLCDVCKKYHSAKRGEHPHYCELIGIRPDFHGVYICGVFEWRGMTKEAEAQKGAE